MKKFARNAQYYAISISIIVASIALAWIFQKSYIRIFYSIIDIGTSIAYYAAYMFSFYARKTITLPTATVIKIPDSAIALLPIDLETFKSLIPVYFDLLITGSNVKEYLAFVGNKLYDISYIIISLLPIVTALVIVAVSELRTDEPEVGDTKAMSRFRRFENGILYPIKCYIRGFYLFVAERKWMIITFLVVWSCNLNVATIALEAIAFVFYFSVAMDFAAIYTQVVKLVLDLMVIFSLPLPILLIAGYLIFDLIRQRIALGKLNAAEDQVSELLGKCSPFIILSGTMGSGKTRLLSWLVRIQEKMFRETCANGMYRNFARFPNFPFRTLEKRIDDLIARGKIRTKRDVKALVRSNEYCFKNRDEILMIIEAIGRKYNLQPQTLNNDSLLAVGDVIEAQSALALILADRYNINYEYISLDFFGYDILHNDLEFNDGVYGIEIFRALENYAEYYYIYTINAPLMASNYSIRWEFEQKERGSLPRWNMDFFDFAKKKRIAKRYAKILDQDMVRLGKVSDLDNPRKDSFEFGVLANMEIDKERGNQFDQKGLKKDSPEMNILNDKYALMLKLIRHPATVEYDCLSRMVADLQRVDDLSANLNNVADEIHLRDSRQVILMPFFHGAELIHDIFHPIFKKLYISKKYHRSDTSLGLYIAGRLISSYEGWYSRRVNRYGVFEQSLDIRRQGQNEGDDAKEYKIRVPNVVTIGSYRTDAYVEFFDTKNGKATIPFRDLPEFKGEVATMEELHSMHSYTVASMEEAFSIKVKD